MKNVLFFCLVFVVTFSPANAQMRKGVMAEWKFSEYQTLLRSHLSDTVHEWPLDIAWLPDSLLFHDTIGVMPSGADATLRWNNDKIDLSYVFWEKDSICSRVLYKNGYFESSCNPIDTNSVKKFVPVSGKIGCTTPLKVSYLEIQLYEDFESFLTGKEVKIDGIRYTLQ